MKKKVELVICVAIIFLFTILTKTIMTVWLSKLAISIIAGVLYAMSCVFAFLAMALCFVGVYEEDYIAITQDQPKLQQILSILTWPFQSIYHSPESMSGYIGLFLLFLI